MNKCLSTANDAEVFLYSYLNNIYSIRKIEQALADRISFMWLSCDQPFSFLSFKGGYSLDIYPSCTYAIRYELFKFECHSC